MAINYVKGDMLEDNLLRTSNLAVDTDLLYLDVQSGFVGIKNTTPGEALDVTGNLKVSVRIDAPTADIGGITLSGGTITSTATDLVLSSTSNNVLFGADIKFTATTANIVGSTDLVALTVESATTETPYYLGNIPATPTEDFDSVAASDGLYMTANGFTVYWVETLSTANVNVYQATLGTAFDLSTIGAESFNTITGGAALGNASSIYFNPDGLTVYISKRATLGFNNEIEKYTVTPAFDLSGTVTYVTTATMSGVNKYNYAPSVSSDGLKAYAGATDTANLKYIAEYDLSPAYDLTTAVFNDKFNVSTELVQDFNYITTQVSTDGTEVFAMQLDTANNDVIASYTLGTAYDITTASNTDTATTDLTGPSRGIWFSADGFNLYAIALDGKIFQFDSKLSTPASATVLKYSGSEKLITNTDGVQITGDLTFTGADSLLTPPIYATASLPAVPTEGAVVYDSTSKQVKFYDGTNWSDAGSSQGLSVYVLKAVTTNAVQTAEALVGGLGGTQLVLPDNTTWRFEANIVARRTDAAGESSGYKFTGVIDRQVGFATTAIVGIVAEVIDAEDDAAWSVTVDADAGTGALRVTANGVAAKDISWVVFVRTVEVSN